MAYVTGQPLYVQALLPLHWDQWNWRDIQGVPDGQTVTITYSFANSFLSYYSGTEYAGYQNSFASFSSAERTLTREILEAWEKTINVDFVEVGSGQGTISFAKANLGSGTAGLTELPRSNPVGGDVWIDTASAQDPDYLPHVLAHEIGHALGLGHPFEEGPFLSQAVDTVQFTTMSYSEAAYSWRFDYDDQQVWLVPVYPAVPMLYDIAAAQFLYGANMAATAGNDTYWFDPGIPMFHTIWDAGGTDAIDLSAWSLGTVLDLRAGTYSSLPAQNIDAAPADVREVVYDLLLPGEGLHGIDNMAMAYGTLIENAFLGAGNDYVQGNEASNYIVGNGGNDTVWGAAGGDAVYGNLGNDLIYGNTGNDWLFGGQNEDTVFGGQDGDAVYGNLGNDMVYGNMADDQVYGGQGDDWIYGGSGDDWLFGNLGNDHLFGNRGNDVLIGGAGADTFVFAAGGEHDVILDFEVGIDRIMVAGLGGIGSVVDDGAGNALIDWGTDELTLLGVAPGQVTADWFVLV